MKFKLIFEHPIWISASKHNDLIVLHFKKEARKILKGKDGNILDEEDYTLKMKVKK